MTEGIVSAKDAARKIEEQQRDLTETIHKLIDRSPKLSWKQYKEMKRYRDIGLTQRETAKLLDISRDTVQKYERIPRQYDLKLLKGGAA